MIRLALSVVVCLVVLSACSRREDPDSEIASDIAAELEHTRAIDNHAHPMRVVSERRTRSGIRRAASRRH